MTIMKSHILHPYEDLNLSFRDIKQIISDIGNSKIDCYEKFDGINLLITWNLNSDELRFARNKTHIKQGGLSKIFLESEFSDRPELFSCLNDVYDALTQAFLKLDFRTKSNIFGSLGGGVWYSIEVLTPYFYNTLKYENKSVIIHQNANSMYDLKGDPINTDLTINFKNLLSTLPILNKNIEETNWVIYPPTQILVRPIDELAINNILKNIDNLTSQHSINSHETIQNFLFKRLSEEMNVRFPLIHNTIKSFIIKNFLDMPGALPLSNITSGLDKVVIDQINSLLKDCKNAREQILSPLEKIIYDFSIQILNDLRSAFVGDDKSEIDRVRKETNRCINILTSNNDPKSQLILQKNMRKLQSIDRINSAMEGIVFKYRNKNYKLTGCFAPINQICGHVKYGLERPPTEKKKSLKPSVFSVKK